MELTALKDDFTLHATQDYSRGKTIILLIAYYLTDPAGNKLTDTAGNYLTGLVSETLKPYMLSSLPDDFTLHAE